MSFNSYIFILFFLPLSVIGYFALNHYHKYRGGLFWIAGMSLWFYGYFIPANVFLILGSLLLNYTITFLMRNRNKKTRRSLLLFGMLANLGILFYFKYYDFFIENVNNIFKSNMPLLEIMLPLGISFFTFQQISYIIDCYHNGKLRYSLLEYVSYVTFFPQLVAGPIVLHDELIPQFLDRTKKIINYSNISKGIYGIALGLSKKVLIADSLSLIVNAGYADVSKLNSVSALFVMLSYTFQVYFDFSGYCDMAIGMGRLFNFELPINFNSPYKALSISEFWARWHMTLTRFFTKYVYIPLGGNRKGIYRTYCNTLIVFFLSGLWHGANWTFLLWGLMHGVALVLDKIFNKTILKVPKVLRWLITFLFVNIAWIYFRADSIQEAHLFISQIFKGGAGGLAPYLADIVNRFVEVRVIAKFGFQWMMDGNSVIPATILIIGVLFAVVRWKNTQEKVLLMKRSTKEVLGSIILLVWCIVSLARVSEFLYFNF